MLIKCPECSNQISDKARTCPICGFPMKPDKPTKIKTKRRQRLPNGFGQITKINNPNLRNKYRASITVGKDVNGKHIKKLLKPVAYFATYNDAYAALVEYHKNPYDLDPSITVAQLYDEWFAKNEQNLSQDQIKSCTSIWRYCDSVKNMRAVDLRVRHIKNVMENGARIGEIGREKGKEIHPTPLIKRRIKSLFTKILDYAVENEIVERNVAKEFTYSNEEVFNRENDETEPHIAFTEKELNILWENVDAKPFVDWILVQSYMGWRPKEMLSLKISDQDFENWVFVGGMKTKAGKRRKVPVHHRIQPLIEKIKSQAIIADNGWLFVLERNGVYSKKEVTYDRYKYRFEVIMKDLGLNQDHKPHDCRKTFVTRLKRAGADEMSIKKLVGHHISDITESAYTDRDIEWLRREVELLE